MHKFKSLGFGPIEVTQKNGERFGTFSAFIKNNLRGKFNLVISRYSHATKVLTEFKYIENYYCWFIITEITKTDRLSGRLTGIASIDFYAKQFCDVNKHC